MVEKSDTSTTEVLTYKQLEPFLNAERNLIETLDKDGNGLLAETELNDFISTLRTNGIPNAALDVRILVLHPNHNYSSRGEQTRDCTLCHSRGARFYSKILLEVPEPDGGLRTIPVDREVLLSRWNHPLIGDFYLLGEFKIRKEDIEQLWAVVNRIGFRWLDLLGVGIIFMAFTAVVFHAALMFWTRKSRRGSVSIHASYRRNLPVPIVAWHWLHGLCVLLLIMTGIHLRLPDVLPIFANFLNAVNLHNLVGTILIVDYLFWISFHLWKREFKNRFFISPRHFFRDMTDVLHYYGYLIFVGQSFPKRTGRESPFDPLERAFFLTIMLVLIPVQAFSGILLLRMDSLTFIIEALGGLRFVDAMHLTSAYLLVASLIIHAYFHPLKKYSLPNTAEPKHTS